MFQLCKKRVQASKSCSNHICQRKSCMHEEPKSRSIDENMKDDQKTYFAGNVAG